MAEGDPIDDAGSRELAVIMRAAARRARREILNPPGGTDRARAFNASRAAARLRDLERDLRALNARANGVIDARVRRSYARGVRDADRLAREAGLVRDDAPIGGALTGAETARAGVLVRRAQGDINKAFRSIATVSGRAIREARALGLDNAKMRRLLAGGAIDGAPTLTVQRVREQMRKIAINGLVEVPGKDGVVRTFKPDTYAYIVYQTAMAEASVIGEVDRLNARGVDLVKIIGSNTKRFCTAFVGKVFSLSGRSTVYPAYSSLPRGGPPFHPLCTKRIVPFNEALASPKERAEALPDDETSKLLNKPPAEAQTAYVARQATRAAPTPTSTRATPEPPAAKRASALGGPLPPPVPDQLSARDQAVEAAMHERMAATFGPWSESLTPPERASVRRYQSQADMTSAGYNDVNRFLREQRPPTGHDQAWVDEVVAGLDSAITKGRLPEATTAYRAVRARPPLIEEWREAVVTGIPWRDLGFASSSLSRAVAPAFFGATKLRRTIFEITLPAGTTAIYPAAATGSLAEQLELLLPRGTLFVIDSIDEAGDIVYLRGRVLE